ncbi:MAG: hypothetical protein R8P61_31105 [Bacteroidia bacterium]|nr:hypothetical protein [Bacteroidia bacterium]
MEMKERNHKDLKRALEQLPEHKAPEVVWDRIERRLASPEAENLREKLGQLNTYRAPDEAWSNIQGQLKNKPSTIGRALRMMLVAATAMLLLYIGLQFLGDDELPANPPMTETKVPLSEMTDIQIADFENKMAEEEEELKACIEAIEDQGLQEEMEKEILQLEELTQTRDSLSYFLSKGESLPGTTPRLDRLEARRNLMIQNLREKLCGDKE